MPFFRTLSLPMLLSLVLMDAAAGGGSAGDSGANGRLDTTGAAAVQSEPAVPQYTAAGALIAPRNYREWVFMSSGLDMSYTDAANTQGHSMFDNVFVEPVAWASFKRTGHWPDHTMFVMEVRAAGSKGSINKSGHYQTEDLMGAEVHIRDESRFKGGWGFFVLEGNAPAALLPESATCYACHQAHGAVDTTFTQFYPTAKPIAVQAKTFLDR